MTAIRHNILKDAGALQQFIKGVKLLKQQNSGLTTRQLHVSGQDIPLSVYDLFVLWHDRAMNVVHGRPVFLPWHRYMLILFEQRLQDALNNDQFGLPYWDWAADGDLPRN
jgi:tyrosinase